jgi:SAM-dependent methyltransferase
MRDPDGTLSVKQNCVVRQLAHEPDPAHFLHSPIAARWVAERRMVEFTSIDRLCIESPRVPFVSQPSEWCDAQLFDASQLTIDLQHEAVAGGYDAKDASAWNVIFCGCRPIFCDLLSFQPLERRAWWAMGQYARHFLMPLLVSKRRSFRARDFFAISRDGLLPDSALRLLGPGVYFTRYAPLFLAARATNRQGELLSASPASRADIQRFRERLHASLAWMSNGVRPAPLTESKSHWIGYEENRHHYAGSSFDKKKSTVGRWLRRLRPEWVADLGCNRGEFSELAAEAGAQVIAVDADHDSIQHLYLSTARRGEVHPVLACLDDLSGGRGWAGTEHPGLKQRLHKQVDTVMMLALLHHLAVGAAIPLTAVAMMAKDCTRSHAIVEFLDVDDPELVVLCAQRERSPAEFSRVRQREAFLSAGFIVEEEVDLIPARRSLALLRVGA